MQWAKQRPDSAALKKQREKYFCISQVVEYWDTSLNHLQPNDPRSIETHLRGIRLHPHVSRDFQSNVNREFQSNVNRDFQSSVNREFQESFKAVSIESFKRVSDNVNREFQSNVNPWKESVVLMKLPNKAI
jgi:hypothetical protein